MKDKRQPKTPADIWYVLSSILRSKLFRQNFLYIGGIMLGFFCVFALVTYRQSSNILMSEFSTSSTHQLEVSADAIDTHIRDMRYVVATLDQNSLVKAFFSHRQPQLIYDKYEARLQELLRSYTYSYNSIDSIYLYSELSDSVITDNSVKPLEPFQDNEWFGKLSGETAQENMLVFPRAKNGVFPYLLCVMKPLNINGYRAAIVLNLNMSKVSYLTDVDTDPYQEIFLVTDDRQVMYSHGQRELLLPLEQFPKLSLLKTTRAVCAQTVSDTSEPYIIAQIHSTDYDWYYVTVTNLAAYTDLLSRNSTFLTLIFVALFLVALILSVLFSVRSAKPIHELQALLNDPHHAPDQVSAENEVQDISRQIIGYVEQNKALSDELAKGLNVLNETKILALQSQINPHFLFNTLNMIYTYECDELGFKHELPLLTLSLSKLLHYAFESTDLVSMDTELEFTKMYLNLMKRRHNHRFQVLYDFAPETLQIKVPKLFIQPIAENAIFHGLTESHKPDSCLKVAAHLDGHICIVEVSDNGVGMDKETLAHLQNISDEQNPQGRGIGLKNTVIRMKLLYGEAFRMQVSSQEGIGSSFVLRFPDSPLSKA